MSEHRKWSQECNGERFKPTERTRDIHRALLHKVGDRVEQEFFEIWEAETASPEAPRRAGSVVALAHVRQAARLAIFGAQCAGFEPNIDNWLSMCREQFNEAIRDVAKARKEAPGKD